MDMIIDLTDDYNSDNEETIKEYLQEKVEDLKKINQLNENSLSEMQQNLDGLKGNEYVSNPDFKIVDFWQKFHNGKWLIGFRTKILSNSSARHISAILKSSKIDELQYSIKAYIKQTTKCPTQNSFNESSHSPAVKNVLTNIKSVYDKPSLWKLSNSIKGNATIVIVIDMPTFSHYKDMQIDGFLLYEMFDSSYKTPIPKISLAIDDVLTGELNTKVSNLFLGQEETLLGVLATSLVTPVRIIYDNLFQLFQLNLQRNCLFNKIDTCENDLEYMYDGKNESLFFCMLYVVEQKKDKINVLLFTQNENQLNLLYHHLYSNIPDIIIINDTIETKKEIDSHSVTFCTQKLSETSKHVDQTLYIDFIESFDRQLKFLEDKVISKKRKNKRLNSIYLKKELNEYEYRSDTILEQILTKTI